MDAISLPFIFVVARARLAALQLIACILLTAFAGSALAACPAQPPRQRVIDPAGLLGAKAGAIAARLRTYQQASGHQLFVLVVPSLDGASIEECAVSVFANWKLGRKGIDDGVLLIVAAKERKIRIEVGYGLEGTLTDVQSSRIIRQVMRPLLAGGDYGEGVERGLGAIIEVLATADPAVQTRAPDVSRAVTTLQPGAVVALIVVLATVLMFTQVLGIVGLAIFMAIVAACMFWLLPDARGALLAAAACAAWCLMRWALIRTNVRKYHLARARNKMHAWVWYFCVVGFCAQARAPRRGEARRGKPSSDEDVLFFSAGDSGGSSGASSGYSSSSGSDSSSDSSMDSVDSGGSSGGGGASDDY